MKLLSVLICCRGERLPVPGAAGVREKGRTAESLLKSSSLSCLSKAMFAASAGVSSRRPMSWSRNCPQAQPHCEMSFSEKRFWPTSLKIRLEMYRGDGPPTMRPIPSA